MWDDLNDITQANILEQLAGKNRASTVAGLLENYELIDEVIESAENATGSAARENEAYMDSIDGKIDQLTNHIQEFWSTFIDTDAVKGVLDFLSGAIELATELVDKLGSIPTLLGLIGAGVSISSGGGRAKIICCIRKVNYPPKV